MVFKKNSKGNSNAFEFRKKRSFWRRIFSLKKLLLYILFILLIVSGYFAITNLELNKNVVLKETEYEGLKRLTKSQLDEAIMDQFGKSMIGINIKHIENRIIDNFIEVSNIKAEKIYPDTIVFTVEEKLAKAVVVNFNGKFLIDENGEILKAVCREDLKRFDGFDYLLAREFGDPNADYVEDIVIQELGEEIELEEFDFAQYPYDEKVKILHNIQQEKKNEFNEEIKYVQEFVNLEVAIDVPYIKSWTEDCFVEGDLADKTEVNFFGNSYKTLSEDLQYQIKEIYWDGEFRLIVELNDGTLLILSPSRELEAQIEDLESILLFSQKSVYDFNLIDLSSPKVLVE